LTLLTLLAKFGVDFGRLDKDNGMLQFVVGQLSDKHMQLPHPESTIDIHRLSFLMLLTIALLPAIFDFLGALFILRHHTPEVALHSWVLI
jgi:hypothetical protein